MTGPPLVAAPENEDAEGMNFEGAGVLSSYEDLYRALGEPQPDAEQIAFTATAAGLDSLSIGMDPLGELSQAGVGWLIEHVWFLHEPLDALAGDPTQITAQARTWHNTSNAMLAVAQDYPRDAAAVTGWDGAAADEYRGAVDDYAYHLGRAAAAASDVSTEIMASGAAVGTVRALIRDIIAEFVSGVIKKALVALAGSFASFGGSAVAFAAFISVEAVLLAADIVRRIQKLLDVLAASAQRLQDAATLMERLPDGVIEASKQFTSAEQEQRSWELQHP